VIVLKWGMSSPTWGPFILPIYVDTVVMHPDYPILKVVKPCALQLTESPEKQEILTKGSFIRVEITFDREEIQSSDDRKKLAKELIANKKLLEKFLTPSEPILLSPLRLLDFREIEGGRFVFTFVIWKRRGE